MAKIALMIAVVWVLAFASGYMVRDSMEEPTPEEEPYDTWLTAPLTREGDYLCYKGADLSEAQRRQELYTYYGRGDYLILVWEPSEDCPSRWRIPQDIKDSHPDWETNTGWAVDFLCRKCGDNYPPEAKPGTTSR